MAPKQLIDKVQKTIRIGMALEDSGKYDAILTVCRQDLIPLPTIKLCHFGRGHPSR